MEPVFLSVKEKETGVKVLSGSVTPEVNVPGLKPDTEYGYTISMPGKNEEMPYKLVKNGAEAEEEQ